MNRRDALTGALLTAVVPSEAVADIYPHVAWLEEWRALGEQYETLPDDGFDDPNGIWGQMNAIAERLYGSEASTRKGMIAQLRFFQEDNLFFEQCNVDPETANRIVETAVAFLSRA